MSISIWSQTHQRRPIDYQRPWYQSALSLLDSISALQGSIVEIGCGNGEFAALARREIHSSNYIGLDGHLPSVTNARQSGLNVVLTEFEQTLPLCSNFASLIIALEVVEHVASARALLLELSRILQPDGHLIISTPNVGYLGFRLGYLLKAEVPCEGIHLRFFNRSLFARLLRETGFELVQQDSIVPLVGYNRLMRILFRWPPRFTSVPNWAENWLALDFVWLLRHKKVKKL
jgi:2-polyprenyl-3-methyl-5-hydroxy-6-metoxy-1,4-benzoquinol methylase